MADTVRYCFLNGAVLPEEEAALSPFDRGFIYGDAIYEVIPAFRGELFALEPHMLRLRRSAAAAHLTLPSGGADLQLAIEETVRANGDWMAHTPICRVGVWISRGVQATDWKARRDAEPTVLVFCWPVNHEALQRAARDGVSVVVAARRRASADVLDPRLKMTSRLPFVLAELETAEQGDMPLLLDSRGHISEASSANVFMVLDGALCTPRAADVLEGVTRSLVIDLARQAGVETRERDLTSYDAMTASEVFMTSSSMGVVPVRRVVPYTDELPVPGPVTRQVMQRLTKETGYSPWDDT